MFLLFFLGSGMSGNKIPETSSFLRFIYSTLGQKRLYSICQLFEELRSQRNDLFLWAVPPSPGSPQFCYLQTTDHTPILTHYKGSLGSKQSSSPGFLPSTSTSGKIELKRKERKLEGRVSQVVRYSGRKRRYFSSSRGIIGRRKNALRGRQNRHCCRHSGLSRQQECSLCLGTFSLA